MWTRRYNATVRSGDCEHSPCDRQTIFLFGHKNPRIRPAAASSAVEQFSDQRGPAGLMRRAQTLAGVAVKILVK